MEQRDAQLSKMVQTWKDKFQNAIGQNWTQQQFHFNPEQLKEFWQGVNEVQDILKNLYDKSYALTQFTGNKPQLANITETLQKVAGAAMDNATAVAKLKEHMGQSTSQLEENKNWERAWEHPDLAKQITPQTETKKQTTALTQMANDVHKALVNIGAPSAKAKQAIIQLVKSNPQINREELFKQALNMVK